MPKPLFSRRIAVLAADGFEKSELTVPLTALKKAGATVDIVSLRPGRIQSVNHHKPDSGVGVTKTLGDVDPSDYDALFVPGGLLSPDLLRQSARARQFVRAFDVARKPIASVCHGPWVMASAGMLAGRTVTSWPGIRDDMVHAGATWLNEPVVHDGNLITSRGPQDLKPFVDAMLRLFATGAPETDLVVRPQASAPQASDPPELGAATMRWLSIPRPSLRAAVGVGLVAAGVVAAKTARTRLRARPEPEEIQAPWS